MNAVAKMRGLTLAASGPVYRPGRLLAIFRASRHHLQWPPKSEERYRHLQAQASRTPSAHRLRAAEGLRT
jgi:hypothetical protein